MPCAWSAILGVWPGAATNERRCRICGLFVLPKSRAPQSLLSRFKKLKMSSCKMKFCPCNVGSDCRADRLTTLSHGARHEFRFMIVPRCELRQGWPLMKFSSEFCGGGGVVEPLAEKRISVVSCAFFGT